MKVFGIVCTMFGEWLYRLTDDRIANSCLAAILVLGKTLNIYKLLPFCVLKMCATMFSLRFIKHHISKFRLRRLILFAVAPGPRY